MNWQEKKKERHILNFDRRGLAVLNKKMSANREFVSCWRKKNLFVVIGLYYVWKRRASCQRTGRIETGAVERRLWPRPSLSLSLTVFFSKASHWTLQRRRCYLSSHHGNHPVPPAPTRPLPRRRALSQQAPPRCGKGITAAGNNNTVPDHI